MAAPKGNTYWKLSKGWAVGNDKSYTPAALWDKAVEYFNWIDKNPLHESKGFSNGLILEMTKLRAMTIKGFCLFAEISTQTFTNYDKEDAYFAITAKIRDIIYTQKFEGAAAGLFETNIIARELGLADKQQLDLTNRDITTSPLNELSTEKLLEIEKIITR